MAKKPYPFLVCEQCAGGGTSGGDVDLSNYLSKDNEEEYTPSSDYNPATKKYVDNAIKKFTAESTDTVDICLANSNIETYDVDIGGRLEIEVNENDVKHVLERTNYYVDDYSIPLPLEGEITHKNGAKVPILWEGKFYTLDPNDLSGISSYVFSFPYGEKGVKLNRYNPIYNDLPIHNGLAICADIKEGSIRSKHMAGEYYTKKEIDDKLSNANDGLTEGSFRLSGSSTDTVDATVGNERTDVYDAFSLTVPITINSDDVKCKIINKTTREMNAIWVCYDEEENDIDEISGDLTDEIDLTQYTNLHHLTVCFSGLGEPGETIEATITSASPTISVEVRDNSIGMSKLDNEVKQKLDNAGGGSGLETLVSTNTIGITTGEIRTYTFDLANIMTVTIPISSVDTHIELNSSVGLMTLFVRCSDIEHQLFPSASPFEIDLTQYDGVYELLVVPTGVTMESGEMTARITSNKPVGSPEVKDGSIGEQQLSQRLKANLVMKTDYATKDVAGAVKVNNYAYGVFVDANGELRVYCAEKSEMTAQNSSKPVAVRFIGQGVMLNTHQQMSDDYDPSTLKVSGYTVGIQNQLPASYDATKGYVDSSISNLIEKLKAAGVDID